MAFVLGYLEERYMTVAIAEHKEGGFTPYPREATRHVLYLETLYQYCKVTFRLDEYIDAEESRIAHEAVRTVEMSEDQFEEANMAESPRFSDLTVPYDLLSIQFLEPEVEHPEDIFTSVFFFSEDGNAPLESQGFYRVHKELFRNDYGVSNRYVYRITQMTTEDVIKSTEDETRRKNVMIEQTPEVTYLDTEDIDVLPDLIIQDIVIDLGEKFTEEEVRSRIPKGRLFRSFKFSEIVRENGGRSYYY